MVVVVGGCTYLIFQITMLSKGARYKFAFIFIMLTIT